jgi:hypothetical protein
VKELSWEQSKGVVLSSKRATSFSSSWIKASIASVAVSCPQEESDLSDVEAIVPDQNGPDWTRADKTGQNWIRQSRIKFTGLDNVKNICGV